jgi:hypothetical protein
VALLVMVDASIPIEETGHQLPLSQVTGDELEGGQAEGALDHQVIGGDEVDFRLGVARVADQTVVRGHECTVEDDRKRLTQLLA